MLPHEKEILAFYDYAKIYYNLPSIYKMEQFRVVSYKRWAINAIIDWLADGEGKSAEDILLEFILWAQNVYRKNNLEMFKVASDTALELYEYFYTDWDQY